MPRGPYQKSDVTREKILSAATELFAQRGYAGTGVDRLAEKSGIAKTAIYYHFGNKEGLLAAVLDRAATVWIENIKQSAERASSAEEALDRALAGMRTMVEEKSWILKLLLLLTLEVADEKPEIRKSMRQLYARARSSIVAGIRDAVGADVPDADMVGNVMLGQLQAVVVGLELVPDLSLDEVFSNLREIVLYMVASRLDPSLQETALLQPVAPVLPEA